MAKKPGKARQAKTSDGRIETEARAAGTTNMARMAQIVLIEPVDTTAQQIANSRRKLSAAVDSTMGPPYVLLAETGQYAVGGGALRLRRNARTAVGRSILGTRVSIELAATGFLLLIEERLASIHQEREGLNSDESRDRCDQDIEHFEDLKRRVENFLSSTSQFSAGKLKEKVVVESTISFAEGIKSWWTKRHVQICERSFEMGLFTFGLTVCALTKSDLAVGIYGAIAGGEKLVEVIKAMHGRHRR